MTKNKPGEKQIETILKKLNLEFEKQKRLFLEKDAKNFRIPDFYLKKYNLIIEYFGSWNVNKNKKMQERERSRFMEKVGAYEASGKNVIYMYPEDLKNTEKIIKNKLNEIKSKNKLKKTVGELVKNKNLEKKIIPVKKPVQKNKIKEKNKYDEIQKNIITGKYDLINTMLLGKTILLLTFINVLTFIGILLISLVLFLQGNPSYSDLIPLGDFLFMLFAVVMPTSTILSAIYVYKKALTIGFIYTFIVFFALFIIVIGLFGDPFTKLALILIGGLGIIPMQFFTVTSKR